jgi:hypothetical protein
MKIEFESGQITIQADASKWGPFTFDFTDALPEGRTLASVSAKTYLGRVKPGDSDVLSTKTDTTSELIYSAAASSDTVVSVYFNRPTTSTYVNEKHTLVLTFTLDATGGGGTHSAFFYSINVI